MRDLNEVLWMEQVRFPVLARVLHRSSHQPPICLLFNVYKTWLCHFTDKTTNRNSSVLRILILESPSINVKHFYKLVLCFRYTHPCDWNVAIETSSNKQPLQKTNHLLTNQIRGTINSSATLFLTHLAKWRLKWVCEEVICLVSEDFVLGQWSAHIIALCFLFYSPYFRTHTPHIFGLFCLSLFQRWSAFHP